MPIVDVEIVLNDGQSLRASLAAELAEVIGSVFETPKGRTWVRLRSLPRSDYSENGGTPDYAQPVFVTILKSQRPQGETLQREVRLLTNAIAAIVDRNADNVSRAACASPNASAAALLIPATFATIEISLISS